MCYDATLCPLLQLVGLHAHVLWHRWAQPLSGLWYGVLGCCNWVPSALTTSCKNCVTPALSQGRTFTRRKLSSPTSEQIGKEQSEVEVSGWETMG